MKKESKIFSKTTISTTFSIQKAHITIKQDKKQQKKDEPFKTILNIDNNIAKSRGYKANTAK